MGASWIGRRCARAMAELLDPPFFYFRLRSLPPAPCLRVRFVLLVRDEPNRETRSRQETAETEVEERRRINRELGRSPPNRPLLLRNAPRPAGTGSRRPRWCVRGGSARACGSGRRRA